MNKNTFNGILFSGAGSLWWGVIGVLYFKSVSFVDPVELIVHRTIWTAFLLLFTISIYSKWNDVFLILKNIKKTLILFLCGILIVTNWFTWIYAVVTNRLVDASFGYYIFPILSVLFGIIFLIETYNKKKLLAISLVIISIIFLLFNFQSTPWVGLIVAITWSTYNLIRKKLKVSADAGLFIESAFMTPFAIIVFYLLSKDGNNFFSPNDLKISFWLFSLFSKGLLLFHFVLLFKFFKLVSSQIDIAFFKMLSLIVLSINAPPPKAITELLSLSNFNTSFFSSNLKNFSPFLLKISEIFIKQFFSIFASVSINFKSVILDTILPKVVLPTPIIPTKTRFFLTLT